MKRLTQRFALHDLPSDSLVVRTSPDGTGIAVGSTDGAIRVYHPVSGSCLYTLPTSTPADALPVTAIRWRTGSAASGKTKNVLLAATADGVIRHWHVSTQRVLSKVVTPDQVYCLDMRVDGEAYAAAGKDKVVRIYDETTGAVQTTFRSGGYDVLGHSNRVFSVKFHPSDPNILVSGGWDNTVILWDVRSASPTTSLFGPHICGDALDIYDHLLLAGSWRPDHQLQVFDLRMLKDNEPAVEVPWTGVAVGSGSSAALASRLAARGAPALIYAAAFSPSGTYIAAGGSGSNEAKLFDTSGAVKASLSLPSADLPKQTPAYPTPTLCGTVAGLSRSVYSLCFSADDGLIVAGGDYLLSYELQGAVASTSTATVEEPTLAFGGAASRVTTDDTIKARPLTATEEAAILAAYGGSEPDASDDEADATPGIPDAVLSPGARFGIAERPM